MDVVGKPSQDPAAFRARLLVDFDGVPTPYGKIETAWQKADNDALAPALRYIAGCTTVEALIRRLWSERPRGASKTTDLAVAVLWILFAATRRISGVAVAADLDQARLLIGTIERIVSMNPWLADFVEVQRDRVRSIHTGAELVVISSDAGSSYGLTPDFVIADEVSHWPEGRGQAMWESLASSAAKKKHCLFVVITNAGWKGDWQWTLREAIRLNPRWRFSRLEAPPDWIDEERLEEQRQTLPDEAYRRLWLNQWVEGSGNSLNTIALAECLKRADGMPWKPVPFRPQGTGIEVVAGIDLGLRRDHAALVLVMADPNRVKLVLAQEINWDPRSYGGEIPLRLVRQAMLEARRTHQVVNVVVDEWNAAQLIQDLRSDGFHVLIRQTTSKQLSIEATTLLSVVNERQLQLFPGMTYDDLTKVRVVERPTGFRLEWPRDGQGHCDRGAALASALPWAKQALDLLMQPPDEFGGGAVIPVGCNSKGLHF